MQYTIEARELTSQYRHRPSIDVEPSRITVEAVSPDDAISEFVRTHRSELVSVSRPGRGDESIATVKKEDARYLVRVYAA